MDYSRNYFCFSILVLFIITTVCSGASLQTMQDVDNTEQQDSEVIDKTEPLVSSSVMTQKVSSSVSSTRTAEGDIIITTSAEAFGSENITPEETSKFPPISLSEDEETESSVPSETKPEIPPSTASDNSNETSVANTETKSDGESTQTTASSTKPPDTEKPNTVKPESTSSGNKPNGASAVAMPNAFGFFLIVFVSRALFLIT